MHSTPLHTDILKPDLEAAFLTLLFDIECAVSSLLCDTSSFPLSKP